MVFERSLNRSAIGLRSPATETLDEYLLHCSYFRVVGVWINGRSADLWLRVIASRGKLTTRGDHQYNCDKEPSEAHDDLR